MTFAQQKEAQQQRTATVKAGTPFRRAILMSQEVKFALALATHLQGAAMAAIGPYESRGKGGSKSKPGRYYRRGHPNPHYGAKESAKFAARGAP